jgi:uncharacterized membrane protein YgcG
VAPGRACHRLRAIAAALPIAAGLAAFTLAQTDRGAYVIRRFDTALTVEPDSNLLVEERLEVEFSEPRHGIFRTIPVRYSDPRGFAYSLDLRLLGVSDAAGARHQARVTNEGRYTKIRIGDPDREVEGVVVYVVRYRVREALARFAEHDEIYWNATGHEWNAPILQSSATVRLPRPVARDDLRAAGYTGAFGETERAVDISYPEPGVIRFVAVRPLEPLEGLTLAVGFPQGIVVFPTAVERAGRLAFDNAVLLLPLAWLAFLVERYRTGGRDPDPGAPVMVTYEPPPGLTPGAVGTLVDERVDPADITATVVDLAIRGHLTIRTEEEDRLFGLMTSEETIFTLAPGHTPGGLLPHEQAVLVALFPNRTEVRASELKNKFYRQLPAVKRALYEHLTGTAHFEASPESVRNRWTGWGIVAGVGTGLVAAGWMGLRGVAPPASVLVPIVAGVLTAVAFLAFARAMPRRTRTGAAARQWALGFQEFATRVEADRLERSAADPRQAFETLLPYAMALGVADEWAERFEGIYEERPPGWYVTPTHGRFSTRSFERSLSGAMAATSRNMTASPRSSSGSGGGGFSGGGGGGGGGGSW